MPSLSPTRLDRGEGGLGWMKHVKAMLIHDLYGCPLIHMDLANQMIQLVEIYGYLKLPFQVETVVYAVALFIMQVFVLECLPMSLESTPPCYPCNVLFVEESFDEDGAVPHKAHGALVVGRVVGDLASDGHYRMDILAEVENLDRSLLARENAIKIQPHMQVTIRQVTQNKLSPKYYGPFMIVAKIRAMAYNLELPSGGTRASNVPLEPERILDKRIGKLNNNASVYVLVNWSIMMRKMPLRNLLKT
ncbi:hypothetical protein Tco_0837743 [Tanacetum coccineum]